MMTPPGRQHGFTLIELLVVISIILLIATFGLTKFMGARRDAEMTASMERLGQIYFHLQRHENKKSRLPTKQSGSEFVLAIWGLPFVEKSVNTSKIFFCASLGTPEITEETLDEDITPETIHWAGRNQEDRQYRFVKLSQKNASKTILICNKPMVEGVEPHQGNALAVLYANGATGEISREDFDLEDDVLMIGPESPIEALHGLIGAPGDY